MVQGGLLVLLLGLLVIREEADPVVEAGPVALVALAAPTVEVAPMVATRLLVLAGAAQYVLSGEQVDHSPQQAQVIYNESLYTN
jgi:hypothetical protein